MRYACIDRRRNDYPVRMMCRLLDVCASGYYAWRQRPESARAERDRGLLAKIRRAHEASKGVYGSPRIHAELIAEGVCVGRHKVAQLMRSARLRGCPKRRFRTTTQRDRSHPVAKNLLKQDFTAEAPNRRWASCRRSGRNTTRRLDWCLHRPPVGYSVRPEHWSRDQHPRQGR